MMAASSETEPTQLLHRLVRLVTQKSDDKITQQYQYALKVIGSNFAPSVTQDEFSVAEGIKRKLMRQSRDQDAARFSELHRKLKNYEAILTNRWSVLYLLLNISRDKSKSNLTGSGAGLSFAAGLPVAASSTPLSQSVDSQNRGDSANRTNISDRITFSSSGISSIAPCPTNSSGNQLADNSSGNPLVISNFPLNNDSIISRPSRQVAVNTERSRGFIQPRIPYIDPSSELSEAVLLKDLMYVFQGIDGKYIKLIPNGEAYRLNQNLEVPKCVRDVINKLSELGWLYTRIQKYIDAKTKDKAFGLVGQSFCAALHDELTEYFRMISVLESQLHADQDQGVCVVGGSSSELTFRRLTVWTFDPLSRLRTLAALVDFCKGKKGGALASAVHSFTHHGDPSVRNVIRNILELITQPIKNMLLKWIYDGDLDDTFHEFCVAADPTVKEERLWHDKYTLRKSMVPSFINMSQAQKILLIGKSINFIRVCCKDRTPIGQQTGESEDDVRERVQREFNEDFEHALQTNIDASYRDTSQHLLTILQTKYKFNDHLQAMRRYLLLGQGDFIRHLMDMLEADLAKPATTLYRHSLSGILETSIRATNAQFDDPDILERLDVRLLEVSPGDCGWDVFSLDYHVRGPISTVFTPECILQYLRVFNFLWRAKRAEYILAGIWKSQMTNMRQLHKIPDLAPVLHQCHMLREKMFNFVHQMQYYMTFEVMECAWSDICKKVTAAPDLDHIIAAHEEFLDTVMTSALLDDDSRPLLTQLRAILDLIVQFQQTQDSFYDSAIDELHNQQTLDRELSRRSEKGHWGITEAEEELHHQRTEEFYSTVIPSHRAELRVLSQSYQDMVVEFLVMLNGHSDVNLRFLSIRLDFNEHYKMMDYRLQHSSKNKSFRIP